MKRVLILTSLVVVGACGAGSPIAPAAPSPALAPGISVPIPLAEGRPQPGKELLAAPSASASAPAAPRSPELPDPEPLRLARQWEYEFTFDRGTISVTGVRALLFDKPVVTSRQLGRYAVELWIGRELLDRIRFDFPGLGAEEPPLPTTGRRPLHEPPPSLAPGATVHRVLMVPASPRATRALLVDRATGSVTELPWPPDRPLAPIAVPSAAPPAPATSSTPPAAPTAPPAAGSADLPGARAVSPGE